MRAHSIHKATENAKRMATCQPQCVPLTLSHSHTLTLSHTFTHIHTHHLPISLRIFPFLFHVVSLTHTVSLCLSPPSFRCQSSRTGCCFFRVWIPWQWERPPLSSTLLPWLSSQHSRWRERESERQSERQSESESKARINFRP